MSTAKPTILIVDDTPANLGVLVENLTIAGYRTLIAEDGEDALERVAQVTPDLILLDIMMPGIDGFETCRRLKQAPSTREVPVLFMTALSGTADKIRGFSEGAVDYVTKPLQNEEVLARIRTHLTIRDQRRKIVEQATELEAQNEMKGQFMRIASHDLRNLLSVMSLRCSLLLDIQHPTPEVMQEALQKMKVSIARMDDIIEGFLSRTGGHGFHLSAGFVELNGILREVVDQYRSLAQHKQVDLVCQCAPNLKAVRADPARMHQVLTNYVSNAIKFSPLSTRVVARTRMLGNIVRIEVEDQGPGVRPDERALLFKEFALLSNKPTGGEESTGLGLSIVKRLVRAQGGQVGADFPQHGGSIFWVELGAR